MKFYLRTNTSAYASAAGSQSTANPKYTLGANNAVFRNYALSVNKGAAGAALSFPAATDATTATRTNFLERWTGDTPLVAQTFGAGTWTFAAAFNEANTNADSLTSLSVYVWRPSTSSVVGYIYDSSADLGTEWSASTTAAGRVYTFTGSNVAAQNGDVLVIEVFRNTDADGQSMATSYSVGMYAGGSTEPTNNSNVTANDVASYIDSPAAITLASFTGDQDAFRFYADDGSESGSTALAAQNTDHTVDISGGDAALLLRLRLQETQGILGSGSTKYQLYWSKNGGAYQNGLIDYYPAENDSGSSTAFTTTLHGIGQSFTGDGTPVTNVMVYLTKSGTPAGNVTAKIFNHSGTFGSSSIGTGSALATSDAIVTSSIPTGTGVAVIFRFTGGNVFTPTNGTRYVLALEYRDGTASHTLSIRNDATSPTHPGNSSTYNDVDSWSASSSIDRLFYLFNSPWEGFNSSFAANQSSTTSRLSGGSGSFVAGRFNEEFETGFVTLTAGNRTEHVFTILLRASDLADADTLDFRLYKDFQPLDAYTVTPRITISTGGGSTYTLTASGGTFSLTGNAANVVRSLIASADVGAFGYTGNAANALKGTTASADAGSFALTGNNVDLIRGLQLTAETGTFGYTGQDANIARAYMLLAESGEFAVTGNNAQASKSYLMSADAGSFTMTGQDAAITRAYRLLADAGVFSVAGNAANVLRGYLAVADNGSFSVIGNNANAFVTAAGSHNLSADAGSFAYAGNEASLFRGLLANADSGVFSYMGNDAAIQRGILLVADSGSFGITGNNTNIARAYRLDASTGNYSYQGQDSAVIRSLLAVPDTGTFNIEGNTSGIFQGRTIMPQSGSFFVAGYDSTITRNYALLSEAGTFTINGANAVLVWDTAQIAALPYLITVSDGQTYLSVNTGQAVITVNAGHGFLEVE